MMVAVMDLLTTIKYRQTQTTEELINELSKRLDLDADNRQVYSVLGMVLLAHSGDSRRRKDSCLNHILRVTLCSADMTSNCTDFITLALLHDIVEDYPEYITGPVTDVWEHLRQEFSREIVAALDALTNPPAVEQEEKNDHHTPVLYHQHIAHTLKNDMAAIVKLADFTDNLMTVALSDDEKWREDLKRRYFPVIPLFIERFKDSKLIPASAVQDYFGHIESQL